MILMPGIPQSDVAATYHWGKKHYIHHKHCWEFNWCNAISYITSRKLTGIDLMQQFWPCRSRAVKIWYNPLQHWNQTEFMWCKAMQYITSLKSKPFQYVVFSAPMVFFWVGRKSRHWAKCSCHVVPRSLCRTTNISPQNYTQFCYSVSCSWRIKILSPWAELWDELILTGHSKSSQGIVEVKRLFHGLLWSAEKIKWPTLPCDQIFLYYSNYFSWNEFRHSILSSLPQKSAEIVLLYITLLWPQCSGCILHWNSGRELLLHYMALRLLSKLFWEFKM